MGITAQRIDRLTCPPGKSQAFLRDDRTPGLSVRVTPTGRKSFVFEGRVSGSSSATRITIGDCRVLSLEAARTKAKELAADAANGVDIRKPAPEAPAIPATLGGLWASFLATSKPRKKATYKPRTLADMAAMMAQATPKKKAGILVELKDVSLTPLDAKVLATWMAVNSGTRAAAVRQAITAMQSFDRWALDAGHAVDMSAVRSTKVKDSTPVAAALTDGIEETQMQAFLQALKALPSAAGRTLILAYVLTGARRNEMAALKWADFDRDSGMVTLSDKVNDSRTIPVGRRLHSAMLDLPRVNEFVFASKRAKEGHITEPRSFLESALRGAAVPQHVTVHGLRRTFNWMADLAGIPESVAMQISGHSPASVHRKYKRRQPEGLRTFVQRVEDFVLGSVEGDQHEAA
jgi:integrase